MDYCNDKKVIKADICTQVWLLTWDCCGRGGGVGADVEISFEPVPSLALVSLDPKSFRWLSRGAPWLGWLGLGGGVGALLFDADGMIMLFCIFELSTEESEPDLKQANK